MKVEDLRKEESIPEFCDLDIGEVFKRMISDDTDWTFMKISKVAETGEDDDYEEYNAVCLNDGDLVWFDWDESVIKVGAKVVIEK